MKKTDIESGTETIEVAVRDNAVSLPKAKVLLLDLETSPNVAYVWGKWEQNVIDYQKEWSIICFSAKWYEGKHITKCLADYKGVGDWTDDERLVHDLWKLCDEADIICAHNGDSFDIKKMNAKFVKYGLTPPSPYKTIDTKKIAKRYFAFNSNSLDDLGKHLGLGNKVDTGGFELWLGCMRGDAKAWKKMKRYCKRDVVLLERIYLRLRPWMKTHPNVGIYQNDELVCPKCGSGDMNYRGYARSNVARYRKYQCQNCGGWGQEQYSDETPQQLKSI